MESSKTDQRAYSGSASQAPRKISAKEILADIREGMSDRGLELKYSLTPGARENLFKKMIEKGLLTETELQSRSKPKETGVVSGTVAAPQRDPITVPVDPTPKPHVPAISPSKTDRGTSQGPVPQEGSESSTSSRFQAGVTATRFINRHNVRVVIGGLILGGICAVLVTLYWGPTNTWTSWLGKTQGTMSWKWIIGCAIIGAVLALGADWIMINRRGKSSGSRPLPGRKPPPTGGPASTEEIEEAIRRIEQAGRDLFGIAGNVGILGLGAAGGGIAAAAVAGFFGATSICGVTTAGRWVGLNVHGSTPWTWIIGCAIVGAALGFSISRLVALSGKVAERKKRTLEDLREQVRIRQKEAQKATVDKDKFKKLQESLTMLLSNNAITPEKSNLFIQGIERGTMTYEFVFSAIEERLQELIRGQRTATA